MLLVGASCYFSDKVIYLNPGTKGAVRSSNPGQDFTNQPLDEEIKYAVATLKKEKRSIEHTLNLTCNKRNEVLAIVFPEIIRWNAFQDIIELTADKTLYVQGGRTVADFSVGHFQMKPSFIEDLEGYVGKHESLQYCSFIIIKEKSEKEARKKRIKRLEQFEWQLMYAYAYWLAAQHKFQSETFRNDYERIRFFAAAYNFGFMKPVDQIRSWQRKLAFPYGGHYKGVQSAYAEISIEFFVKHANDI